MPRVGNDWPSSRVPEGLPSSLNSMVAAVAADGNAIANSPTTPPISQSFITHNLPKRAQGPLVPLSGGGYYRNRPNGANNLSPNSHSKTDYSRQRGRFYVRFDYIEIYRMLTST